MKTLRAKDLAAILELVGELPIDVDEEALALAVCAGLRRIVPCDEIGYSVLDRERRRIIVHISPDATVDGGDEEIFWSIEPVHPLCRAGTPVALLSECLTDRALRATRVFTDWYGPFGIRDEAKLAIGWRRGVSRAIMLNRTGRIRFTDRDRQVLDALRPLLVRLLLPRDTPTVLTRRESEILAGVQRGLSNKEIAQELVISSGTVRKHLENIFAKLNVHSRVAAIATAASGGQMVSQPLRNERRGLPALIPVGDRS